MVLRAHHAEDLADAGVNCYPSIRGTHALYHLSRPRVILRVDAVVSDTFIRLGLGTHSSCRGFCDTLLSNLELGLAQLVALCHDPRKAACPVKAFKFRDTALKGVHEL